MSKRDAGDHSADAAPDDGRRKLLKLGIGALGLGLVAVPGVPAIGFLLHPLGGTRGERPFLPAGKRAGFSAAPVRVDLRADAVDAWNKTPDVKLGSCWVLEREGKLVAFSSVCPHLGCAVDFDAEVQKFKCPCHRSWFTLDGSVEEGPSPRALDTLELKEDAGLVSIRLERFRMGVPTKESV